MHLTIKERVELVLMSGADGATNRSVAKKFNRIYLAKKFCFNKNVCYYYLNCFICFGALFMAQNVCYYYLNCFICFGALFMAHPVQYSEPADHSPTIISSLGDARHNIHTVVRHLYC